MKTGTFAQPGQATEAQPYRRGNFGCAYEWLEDFDGLQEILQHLDQLAAKDIEHRYLCTLDDVSQCSYTCGHAGQDDRLYLDSPDDMDWDDPKQERAWEQASLQHRLAQLNKPEVAQSWEQVCGSLCTMADDVLALLQANRAPDLLLDDVVYVQRIPVSSDDLKIAAQPNGYFSADWDTFQNHAIIRRLRAAGLKFEEEARELASESLAGRSFVVSGKFSRSRDEMKELIEMHGGRNLAAVSANVDYIVAGENMGPAKLKKAEKLGVKIISEEEFIAMVGGQEAPAANGTEADSATTANTRGRNNGAPAATEGGDGEPVQQGELF